MSSNLARRVCAGAGFLNSRYLVYNTVVLVEFGVDKTEDVLDSAESGAMFERLYARAILDPGGIEKNIDRLIQEVRQQAQQEIISFRARSRTCSSVAPFATSASATTSWPASRSARMTGTALLSSANKFMRQDLSGIGASGSSTTSSCATLAAP